MFSILTWIALVAIPVGIIILATVLALVLKDRQ